MTMQAPSFETRHASDKILLEFQSIYSFLHTALDQKSLVLEVFKSLTNAMGASKALFFLVKNKGNGILLKPFDHFSTPVPRSIFLSEEDTLYKRFEVSKSPIFRPELLKDEMQTSALFRLIPRSFACQALVFLYCSDKLKGVMVFGKTTELECSYSTAVENLLMRIGNELGRALDQIALQRRIWRVAKEKSVLLKIGKKISSSLDLNKVLNSIIDSLKEVVPYDAAVIFLINKKTGQIDQEIYRGYDEAFIENIRLKIGQGLSGWVAAKGTPVLVPDVRKDPRYVVSNPHTLSEMAVPLMRGKKVIGVFNVENKKLNAYTRRDLELLKAFASQAAIAIENAQLYKEALRKRYFEKELQVAREIQKALLPKKLPSVKGFAFGALNVPSEQVGGDFYDAIQLADGKISLAIGDVSGKGTPGAILMSNLSATYRAQIRRDLPPNVVLERVNKLFKENTTSGSFATFLYGKLDPKTGLFEYASAGHNPPILVRADGTVEHLRKGGLILGFLPKVEYEKECVHLHSGDILVMYTDGVTEAENDRDQLFGVERLVKAVKKYSSLRPSALKWKIFHELKQFLKGAPLRDDVTMLIVKAI